MPPSALVQNSEYLETHLIAVPGSMVKEYLKSYESLAPMVVPRSSTKIAADDEFTLFAVTTFTKHSAEFIHKCREMHWTPRDFKYVEGGKEEESKEIESLSKEERKLWGEALRLCRTGYSESAMVWIHVLALRVFVETVLRYGLPLDFACGLVQVFRLLKHLISPILTYIRLHHGTLRGQKQILTRVFLIWLAMHSGETRKVELQRMTRQQQQTYRQQVMLVVKSTPLTYISRLRWHDFRRL